MLYIKKQNKKNPTQSKRLLTPPSGKKERKKKKRKSVHEIKSRVNEKNSQKSKLRLQSLSTHHGFTTQPPHVESTMSNDSFFSFSFFVFPQIGSQICTFEMNVKRIPLNENCYKPKLSYVGLLFCNRLQTSDLSRDPGRQTECGASSWCITLQTNMKGLHRPKLQVTVECEEGITQTWIVSSFFFLPRPTR